MPVDPLTQPDLFEIEHMSLQPERLRFGHPERVYLEHWQKLNRRDSAINSGFTYLEWILCPSGRRYPGCISQRDARVAASFAQWLGTNCGMAFIMEAERRIEQERDEMQPQRRLVKAFPMKFYTRRPRRTLSEGRAMTFGDDI